MYRVAAIIYAAEADVRRVADALPQLEAVAVKQRDRDSTVIAASVPIGITVDDIRSMLRAAGIRFGRIASTMDSA